MNLVVNAFENPRQTHRYGHLKIEALKYRILRFLSQMKKKHLSYHLLLCLFLSCLGTPRSLCDEQKDVEESENIGEHHKEDRESEKYQTFVSRLSKQISYKLT